LEAKLEGWNLQPLKGKDFPNDSLISGEEPQGFGKGGFGKGGKRLNY